MCFNKTKQKTSIPSCSVPCTPMSGDGMFDLIVVFSFFFSSSAISPKFLFAVAVSPFLISLVSIMMIVMSAVGIIFVRFGLEYTWLCKYNLLYTFYCISQLVMILSEVGLCNANWPISLSARYTHRYQSKGQITIIFFIKYNMSIFKKSVIYRQIWQLSVKNIHGLYMHPRIYINNTYYVIRN